MLRLLPDSEVDGLSVAFRPIGDGEVARSEDISRGRQYERGIDYAEDDSILGVELLNVSHGVDLAGVPYADELAAALERLHGVQVVAGP